MRPLIVQIGCWFSTVFLLISCGGTSSTVSNGSSTRVGAAFLPSANSINLRLDWIEIEDSNGDLLGPSEVMIQLFVIRTNNNSRLLQAPSTGNYSMDGNGRIRLNDYYIGIDNLMENEEVLVYVLALDKDELNPASEIGTGAALEGGLRALEKGLEQGQLGQRLAGRASLVTFIISQVADIVLDWWKQADIIGEYAFILDPQSSAYEVATENMRLQFSTFPNSSNPSTVGSNDAAGSTIEMPVTVVVTTLVAPTLSNSTSATTAASVNKTQQTGTIGVSADNQTISFTRIGTGEKPVVLVGGMHAGFAPGSLALAERAIEYFGQQGVPPSVSLYVVPNANPDSQDGDVGELSGRLNGNGVDINRNWGCNWSADAVWRDEAIEAGRASFSEPETQALREFFEDIAPEVVISFEARGDFIVLGVCNNRTVSMDMAEIYSDGSGYRIDDITGYTLTGDLSDWLNSQGIPSFAILLSGYTTTDWSQNRAGIQAILNSLDH